MLRFNDTVQQLRVNEAAHLQALSSHRRNLDERVREAAEEFGNNLGRVEIMARDVRKRVLQANRILSATQTEASRQMQLKAEGLLAEHALLIDRLLERKEEEVRHLEEAHLLIERLQQFKTTEALRLLQLPALSGGSRVAYEVAPEI